MLNVNDLLSIIFERLSNSNQSQIAYFYWDEIKQWPTETFQQLEKLKLLNPTQPNTVIECNGCEEGCYMPVEIYQATDKKPARAFIQCDKNIDFGRIQVPFERLRQWQLSAHQLTQLVAKASGITQQTVKELAHWRIGTFDGSKHRDSLLMCIENNRITLKLAGHEVELFQVFSINKNELKLDLPKLKKMVNSPTGLPDGKETAEARGERFLARRKELKNRHVKNFIHVIMQEENLSDSTVRGIITRAAKRLEERPKKIKKSPPSQIIKKM